MELSVQTPGSGTLTLNVAPDDTVGDVKRTIYAMGEQIPVRSQRLTLAGKELEDDEQTLAECGVGEGATLRLQEHFRVIMQTLSGRTLVLAAEPTHTIADLKEMIQEQTGVPVDDQRLIWAGAEQPNAGVLGALGVHDESAMRMVQHLAAGGDARPPNPATQVFSRSAVALNDDDDDDALNDDDDELVPTDVYVCSQCFEEVLSPEGRPDPCARCGCETMDTAEESKAKYDALEAPSDYDDDDVDEVGGGVYVCIECYEENESADRCGACNGTTLRSAREVERAEVDGTLDTSVFENQPADGPGMQIFIKLLSNRVFPLRVQPTDTVPVVKQLICDQEGTRVDEQRLVFERQRMEDDTRTLADYGVAEGVELCLVCGWRVRVAQQQQ